VDGQEQKKDIVTKLSDNATLFSRAAKTIETMRRKGFYPMSCPGIDAETGTVMVEVQLMTSEEIELEERRQGMYDVKQKLSALERVRQDSVHAAMTDAHESEATGVTGIV
jgi:hypothetical protein